MPILIIIAGVVIVASAFGYSFTSINRDTESSVAVVEASASISEEVKDIVEEPNDEIVIVSSNILSPKDVKDETVVDEPEENVLDPEEPNNDVVIAENILASSPATDVSAAPIVAELKEDIKEPTKNPIRNMGSMMMYRDGPYTASVSYTIPYGYLEPMTVSITLEGDTITDAEVQFDTVNPTSSEYQQSFLTYYKDEVIGKEIDEIQPARLGGSSLSNAGFEEALLNIKAEAMGMMEMSASNTGASVEMTFVYNNLYEGLTEVES